MLNLHAKSDLIWIEVAEALRNGGVEVPEGFRFPEIDERDAQDKRLVIEQVVDILIKNQARDQVINVLRDLFLD